VVRLAGVAKHTRVCMVVTSSHVANEPALNCLGLKSPCIWPSLNSLSIIFVTIDGAKGEHNDENGFNHISLSLTSTK